MVTYKQLIKRLERINFAKKKENPMNLQVGDTINYNGIDYVLTKYVEHENTNRNKMTEPNVITFEAFNSETEVIEPISLTEDDKISTVKNDNDLFRIEYTIPTIVDNERVFLRKTLNMLAKTKSEVEQRMKEKDGDIKVVRLEKLLSAKV